MSNQLYRKLQRHVQEREMANMLSSISDIPYASAAREVDDIFPVEEYEDVYRIAREPDARISIKAPVDEQERWVDQVLTRANVKEECYLSLSDFRFAPWFRIRTIGGVAWVMALRSHLQHCDIKVLSLAFSVLLAIEELEWEYAAFINSYDVSGADFRSSKS